MAGHESTLGTPRIGLFLPSTPLSYDLLRPRNVLWEQGVASSNLAVPIAGNRLVEPFVMETAGIEPAPG